MIALGGKFREAEIRDDARMKINEDVLKKLTGYASSGNPAEQTRYYSSPYLFEDYVTVTGGQSFSRTLLLTAYSAYQLPDNTYGTYFTCVYPSHYPAGYSAVNGMTWTGESPNDPYLWGPTSGSLTSTTFMDILGGSQFVDLTIDTPQVAQDTEVFVQCLLGDTGLGTLIPNNGPTYFYITLLGTGPEQSTVPPKDGASDTSPPPPPPPAAPVGTITQAAPAFVDGGQAFTVETTWQIAAGSGGANLAVSVQGVASVSAGQPTIGLAEGTTTVTHTFTTRQVQISSPVSIQFLATNLNGGPPGPSIPTWTSLPFEPCSSPATLPRTSSMSCSVRCARSSEVYRLAVQKRRR